MSKTQYLTLYLQEEIFALEVLRIKEIIPNKSITPIPLMRDYMLGVMNVRGDIVPIINLSERLELATTNSADRDKQSIIIVSVNYHDEEIIVGIMVTLVNKVFEQSADELESSPTFGAKIKKEFIKQIAKVDTLFIPILDLDKILEIDAISYTYQDSEYEHGA